MIPHHTSHHQKEYLFMGGSKNLAMNNILARRKKLSAYSNDDVRVAMYVLTCCILLGGMNVSNDMHTERQ